MAKFRYLKKFPISIFSIYRIGFFDISISISQSCILGFALILIGFLSVDIEAAPTCPICAPLKLGTDAALPQIIKNKGYKTAYGNIVQMNSSCVAEITCFGTNPAPNSETTLYYSEQNAWTGTSVYGTRKLTRNLICTLNGWAEYYFHDFIRANNIYYCVALPPPDSTSHNCSAPITTTTTTKSSTSPTTTIKSQNNSITTTLAPGTCPSCSAFPFTTEAPNDFESIFLSINNSKPACGSVTSMNSSCLIRVNCAPSTPQDTTILYYKAGSDPKWHALGKDGAVTLDFICTSKGWARAQYPSIPWKSVVCMANLPTGQVEHTCSPPPPPPPTSLPKPVKCPVDWYFLESTNSCYSAIFNCSFDGCERECLKIGARLASIHSKAENRFVNDMAGFGSPLENSQTTIGKFSNNNIGFI